MLSLAGVPGYIAESVVGHAIPGIAAVYDRHDYVEQKRDALLRLEALISELCDEQGSRKSGAAQTPTR